MIEHASMAKRTVNAVERAEFRILDALYSLEAATERQLRQATGIKRTTCHKALWQLRKAGTIAVVGRSRTTTNYAHIYALMPEGAESYRETPMQAATFARRLRSVHPLGFQG